MKIERVNGYEDKRFPIEILKAHNAFLVDEMILCYFEIFDTIKAKVICDSKEVVLSVIEEFRYYAPHVCLFYDETGKCIASFPQVEIKRISLNDVMPSQFYINQNKLKELQEVINIKEIVLPVARIDEQYVLTDGHTRAYLAYQKGVTTLQVVMDEASDYIVDFMKEAKIRGIHTIKDLQILNDSEYEMQWIGFCKQYFQNHE